MIEQVIVTYIDILGYKKLIERHMDNINAIKTIEAQRRGHKEGGQIFNLDILKLI